MPRFTYKAKDSSQKTIQGTVEAADADEAVRLILASGYSPFSVVLEKSPTPTAATKKKTVSFLKRISISDKMLLTSQLYDLIDAGVPLLSGLKLLSGQTKNKNLKEVVVKITRHVEEGGALSSGLALFPLIFPVYYIQMVRAGERSGSLVIQLHRLTEFLKEETEARQKILSSLMYPALLLSVGILTIFVLLTVVIPKMMILFDDFDQTLPLITRMLIFISHALAQFWWAGFVLLAGVILYLRMLSKTEKGKFKIDQWKFKIPLAGPIVESAEIGRLARTLGTLIENGVDIRSALESARNLSDNSVIQREVKKISSGVTDGLSLAKAVSGSSFFLPASVQMIEVGEATGHAEKGLYKLASSCEREAQSRIRMMTSIVGPIMILVMGSIVGFIVIAMLLPVFRMNLMVQ